MWVRVSFSSKKGGGFKFASISRRFDKDSKRKGTMVNQKFVYVHRDDYFALKIGELDGLNIVWRNERMSQSLSCVYL